MRGDDHGADRSTRRSESTCSRTRTSRRGVRRRHRPRPQRGAACRGKGDAARPRQRARRWESSRFSGYSPTPLPAKGSSSNRVCRNACPRRAWRELVGIGRGDLPGRFQSPPPTTGWSRSRTTKLRRSGPERLRASPGFQSTLARGILVIVLEDKEVVAGADREHWSGSAASARNDGQARLRYDPTRGLELSLVR